MKRRIRRPVYSLSGVTFTPVPLSELSFVAEQWVM